jgi:hypothetical protein
MRKFREIGAPFAVFTSLPCIILAAGCFKPVPNATAHIRPTEPLSAEYAELRAKIVSHNDLAAPSAWLMNSEHLFIEDESLREEVIIFSRKTGGLDFLFNKVLSSNTADQDMLVISEILVYFGGHLEVGDENITSSSADEVLKSLRNGRASIADKLFDAPVTLKIEQAANKASKNNLQSVQ